MDGTSLHRLRATSGARLARHPIASRLRFPSLALGIALVATPATAAYAVPDDIAATPDFTVLDTAPASDQVAAKRADKAAMVSQPVVQVVTQTAPDTPDDEAEPIGAGNASWYGRQFAGRPTASGERFNPTGLTAAHRTLPFGSKVRVTSQRTGQSIVVRINDRGPFHGNRLIDLSEAAADAIGLKARGQDRVQLALLD